MGKHRWMLYGATGYTAGLIIEEAKRQGLRPVLGGRGTAAIEALGRKYDLPTRVFSLSSRDEIVDGLHTVDAVLHCAGPFVRTSRPMIDACLASHTHYLDITGEIGVFERILRLHAAAQESGIALLPGVGFDVVPTDCLAARLAAELPSATELDLAFLSAGGSWSRGTLNTMIESLPYAGAVRRDGKIVEVPMAYDARQIPFDCGSRWAMTIPWGDVSTAFYTTGIPDIRVYAGTPLKAIRRARRSRLLLPVAGLRPLKSALQRWVGWRVDGPDSEQRIRARMHLWGEARDGEGRSVSGTFNTPEGYTLTAKTALACLDRVLRGEVAPGARTPARAFGADFVFSLAGVSPLDLRTTTVIG